MASHARASALIGAGTLVSRITGLVRSIVLVAVIGSVASRAADAFSTAVSLPQQFYELIAAGVITGIIVPQIVKAAGHRDGGSRFVSKLITLGTVILLGATVLLMAIAPLLIWLFAPHYTPEQQALAVSFAYWVLPQLLFYGLFALVGEALNARKVFGPYAWAPAINNIVSIAGFGVFIALFGGPLTDVADWDAGKIALLGGVATGGIVLQLVVLLLFWRRTGLHVRPDFRWRGIGLRHIGTLAWWTFLTVVVGQLAGIVQSQAVSSASGDNAGIMTISLAWLLFMLPHSIVTVSISTTYFTQLTEFVENGDDAGIRTNLDESIRSIGLFVFGLMAAIAAAAVPLSRVLTNDAGEAVAMAWVLCAYLVALVPLGVTVVVRRAFFAYQDTRTPFLFSLVQAGLSALGAALTMAAALTGMLPLAFVAATVALTQSIANIVQLPIAVRLLRRHLPSSFAWGPTWRALARFGVAAVPAFLAGWGLFLWTGGPAGWTAAGLLSGILGGGLIGATSLLVYVAALAALRAPELAVAGRYVRRFLPGR
ncbi:murein biosynthesis integral membrane protein MurJ [Microbacterium sp. No. 7]|uniref:murein biosynthesis integral membrane protein MurJ n=1 Tax=Microbacterium sp. No. 7 TaxID=1714373 RepID=UPI0006D1F5F2|nr:murein biosynthesis integral membrane protein MurJ [Microbacterium sp. No. 7]ALJ22311.1 virulence factor MviN [Microbacterium sp. No. 7]